MLNHLKIIMLILAVLPLPALAKNKLTKEEKNWLYKVDFIITTEERRTFRKRLKSGYERQKFIDLFWAKRDPDLSDNYNPFKDEYLARYDYVMTHYENGRYRIPKDDRSYIYLMLGKPTRKEPRIDVTLMGTQWRNKYLQHRPELWTYEEMDYNYKRKKLKIQLVPTSTFGDYVAYMDNYSINWLRRVKYKFIINPDLEVAPLTSSMGGESFRNVVELEKKKEQPATTTAKSVEEKPVETTVADEPAPVVDAQPTNMPKPESKPVTTPLTVPTPVVPPEGDQAVVNFSEQTGNPLGLQARMGYFKSGANQTLLLIRMGFPLSKLEFDFLDNQFRAPFQMRYSLEDEMGKVLQSDIIQGDINLPDLEVVKKKNTYYSKELAIMAPADYYILKVQLQETGTQRISFFEEEIEVPPLDRAGFSTNDLTFMDPNIDPSTSSFNIAGKPYGFHLSPAFTRGQRLYPVLEIFGQPDDNSLDSIQMHALKNGEIIHTWVLYPEEMTPTTYNTVLVHPELRTMKLDPGEYQIQFEMELPSGDLLLSESPITIDAKAKSR